MSSILLQTLVGYSSEHITTCVLYITHLLIGVLSEVYKIDCALNVQSCVELTCQLCRTNVSELTCQTEGVMNPGVTYDDCCCARPWT